MSDETIAATPDDRWGTSRDQQMRQILARLEVTSNGRIYSYQPVGSKGAFQGSAPTTGDSSPPHIRWAHAYNECVSDGERDRVIREANRELGELTCRPVRLVKGESVADRDRRLLKEGAGWSAREVADRFRVNLRDVWRIRREGGRDKDYGGAIKGREAESKRLQRVERQRRVRELKERYPGMTARQIGMHVGVDHKTVQQDLRDAA